MNGARILTPLALMMVSFAVTCVLLWHPRTHLPTETPTAPPHPWWPARLASQLTHVGSVRAAPVTAVARRAVPSPRAGVPASEEGAPPLPVMLAVTSHTAQRHSDDADGSAATGPPGTEWQVDLYSSLDRYLVVTVVSVNVSTRKTTQTDVVLQPSAQSHVGSESGLSLEPGDQVIVRSSGYHEVTQVVP
jgi:hypothetical protein